MQRKNKKTRGLADLPSSPKTTGSHLPFLKAAYEAFAPSFVVELGMGNFSTPWLHQQKAELLSIEHDAAWHRLVTERLGPREGWEARYVPLGMGITKPMRPFQLTTAQRQHVTAVYRELARSMRRMDLLFVDSFASTRTPALIRLYGKASVIVLHDTESRQYDYKRFDPYARRRFMRIRYSFLRQQTTLFVRRGLKLDMATFKRRALDHVAEIFCGDPAGSFVEAWG